MRKPYAAAIAGYGNFWTVLRRTWGNRFSAIRCIIMVMERDEKLVLRVRRDARTGDDMVLLTQRNWRTGYTTTLYDGRLAGGTPNKQRHSKD